jgi:HlyD family secretion protein
LIIPENAVFTMENIDYVFVASDGFAELREIQTGIQSGNDMEVLSGLSEGELVIQSPDGDLEEGAAVEVIMQE